MNLERKRLKYKNLEHDYFVSYIDRIIEDGNFFIYGHEDSNHDYWTKVHHFVEDVFMMNISSRETICNDAIKGPICLSIGRGLLI